MATLENVIEEFKVVKDKIEKESVTKAELNEKIDKAITDYEAKVKAETPKRVLEHQLPEAEGDVKNVLKKMPLNDIVNLSPNYSIKSWKNDRELVANNPLFTEEVKNIQKLNDELVITACMIAGYKKDLAPEDVRRAVLSLKGTPNYIKKMTIIGKALDTAETGVGKELVFTGLSQSLIDRARIDAKVASLFTQIDLPQNPFDYPIRPIARARLKKGSENTADDGTKVTAVDVKTGKISFSAKSLKARVVWSSELEEDSILPLAPFIREEIIEALTYDMESGILNSDSNATHFDYDTAQVTAHPDKVGWNGLRSHCVDNSLTTSLATFNIENLRNLRKNMSGVFSATTDNLAYIVSTRGFLKILSLPEREREVSVTDKQNKLPGQLISVDGVPVIVSGEVRDDVTTNGYNENGGTNTQSTILLVNRKAWNLGQWRRPTVKSDTDIELDTSVAVVTWRGDFVPVWGSAGKHTFLGLAVA